MGDAEMSEGSPPVVASSINVIVKAPPSQPVESPVVRQEVIVKNAFATTPGVIRSTKGGEYVLYVGHHADISSSSTTTTCDEPMETDDTSEDSQTASSLSSTVTGDDQSPSPLVRPLSVAELVPNADKRDVQSKFKR
jgi:hypothetical protein